MTRAVIPCIAAIVLLACPGGDERTPATDPARSAPLPESPDADAKATPDPEGKTEADAASKDASSKDASSKDAPKPTGESPGHARPAEAPPADPAALAKARRLYLARLNEGRGLTKAGKYTEAIAVYLQALGVDPSDVALLGELGWASFKGGDLPGARHATTHGLRFARTDDQRGMLTYNLGRIAEAEGDPSKAAELYRDSLGHRDHATVRERLAALAAPPPAPAPTRGLKILAEGLATLEQACTMVIDGHCEDWKVYADDDCHCEPTLKHATGPDDWAGVLTMIAGFSQDLYFLVMKTPAGYTVTEQFLSSYNPGAFGIYEDVELSANELLPDLLGPGKQGWHLAFRKDRVDRDMGVNEIESELWIGHVFCAREGDRARCSLPVLVEYGYQRDVDHPEMEEPGMDHEGLPKSSAYSDDASWAGGTLTIEANERDGMTKIEDDPGGSLPAGAHDLRSLMGL